ncbi:MAG: hypothetical protein M0C28_06885 [Candidatus Moduliflexus flocculans]|nr:hypothetical protein [Candidatus Moduliflexus flocculans]
MEFEGAPGGEGSNHAIDPTDPNIVYSAGFYGTISRAEYGKPGPYPGAPFQKELLPVLYENETPLRGQWLAPFILSPHNPNILYHGMQYVFRSLDRGDTWERISPDLTTNDAATRGDIRYQTLFTISESPIKSGLLYAGTDDGRLWMTKDGGKAWTEITAGLAPAQVDVAGRRLGLRARHGLPDPERQARRRLHALRLEVDRLRQDLDDRSPRASRSARSTSSARTPSTRTSSTSGRTWASTSRPTAAKTWTVLGGNLPTVYVHDLVIHPRDNIIVIATHGRGMWALDAEQGQQQIGPEKVLLRRLSSSRTLSLDGVGPVLFVRSRRARRISLTVRASRGVRVALPVRASFEEARLIALGKLAWIRRAQARVGEARDRCREAVDAASRIDRRAARTTSRRALRRPGPRARLRARAAERSLPGHALGQRHAHGTHPAQRPPGRPAARPRRLRHPPRARPHPGPGPRPGLLGGARAARPRRGRPPRAPSRIRSGPVLDRMVA